MAEKQHQMTTPPPHHITGKTVILASVAGAIIGGPLIALMGFSFVATMTLIIVTSPLFILFSPLLFGAAFVFTLAMLGFAAAGAMAVVGVAMVARSFTGGRAVEYYGGGGGDKFIESGEAVKEEGKDWGGYLQQRADNPHEINVDT